MAATDETNGRIKIPAQLFYAGIAVAGWMISGWFGYFSASSTMNARVSVLESQYQQIHAEMEDIRADLKTLLARK